jgi:hypothetical protein
MWIYFLIVMKILVVHQIGSFCSIYLGLRPNTLYKEKKLDIMYPNHYPTH